MDSKDWTAVDRQIARKRQSIRRVLIRETFIPGPLPESVAQPRPAKAPPTQPPRTFSPL